MSGQPTDEQVRAGAEALVRLHLTGSTTTRLADLPDEAQAGWVAEARAVLEAARPRPSQGQSIPADQLAALRRYAEQEADLGTDDPVEEVAKAAYAVGYAAALGHRITVGRSGAGLLIGDRVDVPPESARP